MVSDEEFNRLDVSAWQVKSHIPESSNGAHIVEQGAYRGVYKAVAQENPLWDFPESTLTLREYQAFLIDRHLNFNLIPSTMWVEDAEYGPGIIQRFIENASTPDIRLIGADVASDEWITILKGEIEDEEVFLQHNASSDIYEAAVFDVLINNSDRKAGHLLRDTQNKLWLIDHGVCFHTQDKLRTILWGWIGSSLAEPVRQRLETGLQHRHWRNDWLLSDTELMAFESRISKLLEFGMPEPQSGWPALPSPLF